MFREMGHRKLLDGRLGQIFLKSFTKYIRLMEKQGSVLDLPFIYSQAYPINPSEIKDLLVEFLLSVNDKNTLKALKDEVKFNFEISLANSIFSEVANTSRSMIENSFDQNISGMHQEHNTSLNTTQDFLGMEWIIDKDQSFDTALSMALAVLRKMVLSRRFKEASEFNADYLNRLITQFSDDILQLNDNQEDLEKKSLVQEKELLSKILDSIASAKNFRSTHNSNWNASSINESIMSVFGCNSKSSIANLHETIVNNLSKGIFLENNFWIFDFFEVI